MDSNNKNNRKEIQVKPDEIIKVSEEIEKAKYIVSSNKKIHDYIKEKQEEYDKKKNKVDKRIHKFKKRCIILGSILIVSIIAIIGIDSNSTNSEHNLYSNITAANTKKVLDLASKTEMLKYNDTYSIYENGYLGNLNMNAINYGIVASNAFGYTSIDKNKNKVIFHGKSGDVPFANNNISYINLQPSYIYYRNNSDKKIYVYDIKTSETKEFISEQCGETIVTSSNIIYYVNYDDKNTLYKYNITSGKKNACIGDNIKNYAIIGDEVIYLDYNNVLHKATLSSGVESWSLENIEKFYYDGNVIAQNNGSIIEFSLDGHKPKKVISYITELLGACNNDIYYSKLGEVFKYSNGKSASIEKGYDYCKGVYKIDDKKTIVIGGNKNEAK